MIDWWFGLSPQTHHLIYIAAGTAVVLETILQVVHHRRKRKEPPKW